MKKKILIVDDSVSIRQMVQVTLKNEGYEVIAADDGVNGLEEANKGQFDLIVTDINMPRMNGFELTEELRKIDKYKYTPILVLTTESEQEKKQKGRKAGATGWIVKPFNPINLISTIDKVLKRRLS